MTRGKIYATVRDKVEQIELKANSIDVYYVVIFWLSPINDAIEYRVGYFEDFTEAIMYQTKLIQTYKSAKYYVSTNISSADTDGGLLQ